MKNYLNYRIEDNEQFISTYDEAPLWSASFGLFLLKHLQLKPNLSIVDIGSGTGFPLIELAERAGSSCQFYGVDVWRNANQRARQKVENYGLKNVKVLEASADDLPFESNSIDLVVSNLGINNFENSTAVFKECHRVLKPAGRLVTTTNIEGHWKEFYQVFYQTLAQIGKSNLVSVVKQDEERRGTEESTLECYEKNGFKVVNCMQESFVMKFLNGSAFLNHHFVKLGWLSGWMQLFPEEDLSDIFLALEQNLNEMAAIDQQGLSLTVPMLYTEGCKND